VEGPYSNLGLAWLYAAPTNAVLKVRPRMPDALARADAGGQIGELLDEMAELQQEIMLSPAVTLQDDAVKLRRLSVYVEDREPARLLAGALERAAA
jgi:hypothetical protein